MPSMLPGCATFQQEPDQRFALYTLHTKAVKVIAETWPLILANAPAAVAVRADGCNMSSLPHDTC